MERFITIAEVNQAAHDCVALIAARYKSNFILNAYAVPRGGIPAAYALAHAARMRGEIIDLVDDVNRADIIIDDIYDSGATAKCYNMDKFFVLFDKREQKWKGQWLVMPWEVSRNGTDASADDIVTRLLQYIGEDPRREGLRDTPRRVLTAWREWATGYGVDPSTILKTFEDGAQDCDEMVIVHNIPVISKCEHHLADITGIAHVGYIPNGKIVGLSKLARLVNVYARRLQVQERMTVEIAQALEVNLQPRGVGVLIRAAHACMSTRGVKIHGSVTTTSAMRGALMASPEARKEFMDLCAMAERD